MLTDRTPERILAEWRAAEAELDPDDVDPSLFARITELRDEHAAAVASREDEARELAQPPSGWEPA
jgi:hypothetical protein